MKTFRYFLIMPVMALLMAAGCSDDDNEFYNDVFVTSNELIQVEPPIIELHEGDYLIISTTNNFQKLIVENGQATPLDLYRSTGGARAFNFTFVLERESSAGNWETVDLSNKMGLPDPAEIKGLTEANDLFVTGHCILDDGNIAFHYRNGIKLLQTGTYRLSFGYNSSAEGVAELRSESGGNNLFLNITSPVAALQSGSYYNFIVI